VEDQVYGEVGEDRGDEASPPVQPPAHHADDAVAQQSARDGGWLDSAADAAWGAMGSSFMAPSYAKQADRAHIRDPYSSSPLFLWVTSG